MIIAGAGGAAHLPGMVAAMTHLPVLGVPVESKALNGQDSLLSIVQMPAGIPVGTLAIGEPGATNAGLLAAAILATSDRRWPSGSRRFARRRPTPSPSGRPDLRTDPARQHHRHPRRRPARAHAGDGRGAARLSLPRLFAREGQRRGRSQRALYAAPTGTTARRSPRFAEDCAVVTYEFENVPVAPLAAIPAELLAPTTRALEVAQDR